MIVKLPKWVLVNKFPAMYDTESLTAVEQTARLYGKMNELVDSYNGFIDEMNLAIENFVTDSEEERQAFETAMRQEFQNFIGIIDLKIQELDKEYLESFTSEVNDLKAVSDNLESEVDNLKAKDTEILSTIQNFRTQYNEVKRDLYNKISVIENVIESEIEALKDKDTEILTTVQNNKTEDNEKFRQAFNSLATLEAKDTELEGRIETLEESGGSGSSAPAGYKLICDYSVNPLIDSTANINTFADGTPLKCNEMLLFVDCYALTLDSPATLEAPIFFKLNGETEYPFSFGYYKQSGKNTALFTAADLNYQQISNDAIVNSVGYIERCSIADIKYYNGRLSLTDVYRENCFAEFPITHFDDESITSISVDGAGYCFAFKLYGR